MGLLLLITIIYTVSAIAYNVASINRKQKAWHRWQLVSRVVLLTPLVYVFTGLRIPVDFWLELTVAIIGLFWLPYDAFIWLLISKSPRYKSGTFDTIKRKIPYIYLPAQIIMFIAAVLCLVVLLLNFGLF